MKFACNYSGQVVLITGACGNLGQMTARAFQHSGATLALLDLNEKALTSAASLLDALPLPCDLTQMNSVTDCVAKVIDRHKRIDALVNIAGGFRMGAMAHETPDADWDFMLNLNARSVFNACRAVIPHMLEEGEGRIINIAARAAVLPKPRMSPYITSKAAVIALTEALATEHKFTGINVNCLLPGTIDTPENRASMPDADFSQWVQPQALADVILFLASDAARAVNGAAIPVYGRS